MYKKVLILITIFLLASCSNTTGNDEQAKDYDPIVVKDYKPSVEGYPVSYSIDAVTENSPDDFKVNNLLFVPNDEMIKIEYGNFSEDGNGHNVTMKLFYDYEMIDFKLADADTYQSEYKFNLRSGEKIEIPILLNEDSIVSDENIHKLLVTFTTGSQQNASDFDIVTDEYGVNAVFDVVHNLNYENNIIPYSYDYILPENNFEQNYGKLIFNTDYENATQKSEFGGVLNPTSSLNVKRGSDLDLMYNLNKNSSDSALLIMTINFEQVNINNKYAELIKLDGKEGTANGRIKITVPDTPGKFEVIGYVVHDPFDKYSGSSNLVYPSYRFTLVVE